MSRFFHLQYLIILFLMIAPAAYGVGGNPDDTWYTVGIYPDSLFAGQVNKPTNSFTTFAEAEAAMRQAVPYGDKLVLESTSGSGTSKSHYYHFEYENVIPGDSWMYRGYYGGYFNDVQGAIDQFLSANQYACKTEEGPLGPWELGTKWYCYPPGQPSRTEIATYNLRVLRDCGNSNSGIDVDPVFCRSRIDHCPEYLPRFTNVSGVGNVCVNHTRAMIYEFKCQCNQIGAPGCTYISTTMKTTVDELGAIHYHQEATDSQYNPLNCPEKIEIPKKCDETLKGNPVDIASGCKIQQELDYAVPGNGDLKVSRSYSSVTITTGLDLPKPYAEKRYGGDVTLCSGGSYEESTMAGSRVTYGNMDWALVQPSGCPIVILYTPFGSKLIFSKMNTAPGPGTWYEGTGSTSGRVQQYYSYYYYYDKSGKKYAFVGGKLESITQDNTVTRFKYSGGNLESVTDAYGRELKYTYDENGRIKSILTPDGTISYAYDTNGNLIEVVYPDETPEDEADNPRKHYLFEDGRFPNALTGIVNENGVRYASWTYDNYGRAISSEHNGGAERYEFEYLDGTTTLVRQYSDSESFNESMYTHARYNGREVVTSVTPSGCDNCAIGKTIRQYDPLSGDLISSQSANGVTTTYEYDDRHRQIKRTIAAGTPQERVVETIWDETLNKPLQVIEGGKITEFTYDPDGDLLTRTERAVE